MIQPSRTLSKLQYKVRLINNIMISDDAKLYENFRGLGPTQAAVRRQLAEEEAKDLAAGKDFTLDDKVSPSVLIAAGLDLEAEQYVSYSWHFYTVTR
jgi:hypothetical protein